MTNCCTQQYCHVEFPCKLFDKKPKKVKVHIFWEGLTCLKQSSTFFLMLLTKKNGRLFQIFVAFSEYMIFYKRDFLKIIILYSRNLLSFVQSKGCDAIRSDVLNLPIRDGVATACINIAVIHHLSTKVHFSIYFEK